jgi:hypothetical protein
VQGQEAKMSFEGDEKEGVVNIVAKLTVISSQPVLVCLYVYVFVRTLFQSLKFQVVQHAGTAIDAQIIDGVGLLICVLGQLKTDDDPPHAFSQTFILKQVGECLFITNDIFRLSLHNA